MNKGIKFKGITPKLVKDKSGDYQEIFLVKFEVITEDFDNALEVKELFENQVANLLNEQTDLGDFKKNAEKED